MSTPNNTGNGRPGIHQSYTPEPSPMRTPRQQQYHLRNTPTQTAVGFEGTPVTSTRPGHMLTAYESTPPASNVSLLDSEVPLMQLLANRGIDT